MERMKRWFVIMAGIGLVLSGCGTGNGNNPPPTPATFFDEPISLEDPQGNPADPHLETSTDGKVFLSWTEHASNPDGYGNRDVFVAELTNNGKQLGERRQINDRPVNARYENRPRFTIGADGSITATLAVLSRPGMDDETADLGLTRAESSGPFAPIQALNDDQKIVPHVNCDIVTAPDGKIYVAWLDRRDSRDGQVFLAVSEDNGKTFGKNYMVSPRAGSSSRANIVFLDGGETMVISHRLPRGEEPANHAVIRSTDGGKTFSDPVVVSDDGWVAHGPPHAGLSMTADSQDRIHALWWTGGRSADEGGIYHAYSEDGGRSFAPRQLVAKSPADTIMMTQVEVDKNDTLYAAWVNVTTEKPHIFFAYRTAGGDWSEIYQVSSGDWYAFWPVLSVDDSNVYLAWEEREEKTGRALAQNITSRVKLNTAPLVGN